MKVNLSAPVNTLGYGYVSLNLLRALCEGGHEVALFPIGGMEVPDDFVDCVRGSANRAERYDKNAPSLRLFHQFDLSHHVGRAMHVGWPIFELDRFTQKELHHLQSQDKIIVCSDWAKQIVFEARGQFPGWRIGVVPLGVDTDLFAPVELPPPSPVTFLVIGKWEVRKGHDIILGAFESAFKASDDVRLVLHCHNPCLPEPHRTRYNAQWENYFLSSRLREKIVISRERKPCQTDVANLIRSAHCLVLPSRAEGWNMEALEGLSMGRHLVITNASAHTQYVNKENSRLIHCDGLEDAHDGVWFSGQGRWASLGSGQIAQAASHMRAIYEEAKSGTLPVNNPGVETAKKFTWAATARRLVEVLNERED